MTPGLSTSIRERTTRLVGWLLLWVVITAPQHYREDAHPPNEASRLYAALALSRHGTTDLSPVFDDFFPGWRSLGRPPNADVAEAGGQFLLDKAPGLTLLAVPIIAAADLVASIFSSAPLGFSHLAWLLSALLCGLSTVGFIALLHRRLNREAPVSARFVPVVLALATPWLAYAGMLMGHALAASLFGSGLLLAMGPLGRDSSGTPDSRRAATGGLLLGLAILVEYPVAVLVLLACVSLASDPYRRRSLPWVTLGVVPSVVALIAWNVVAFGGPLEMSYSHKVNGFNGDRHHFVRLHHPRRCRHGSSRTQDMNTSSTLLSTISLESRHAWGTLIEMDLSRKREP